jgi:hypothetical protein
MAIGPSTAKELAHLGANLDIRSGIGPETAKEIARICAQKGTHLRVGSKAIGPNTAKEIVRIAKDHVTILIES